MASSSSRFDRRGALAAGLGWLGVSLAAEGAGPPPPRTLDIHVHLFGAGEGGTGCRLARSITSSFMFFGLVTALGLRKPGKTLDAEYERALVDHVEGSGLTKAAILGQDAVYKRGKPDWANTPFYTPNDYVFDVVARHPRHMIPCPSINPDREDAIVELARCHQKGARLFKIHPPTQGVDLADRKHTKFFRVCAALGLVVMVHTGHEHSAPVFPNRNLASPLKLQLALDQGCTVVACHAGTGWKSDKPDMLPAFLLMIKRYKNLWGDTSVLGTANRVTDFGRLLKDPFACSRLLHGSDFPFPAAPAKYASRIGAAVANRIAKEKSWIEQDFELKKALGIGLASARRAYEVVGLGTS